MTADPTLTWPNEDLKSLIERMRMGKVSSVELTEAHLNRIEQLNPVLRACVTVLVDQAREQARAADALRLELGDESPRLLGIPLAVKDNFEMQAVRSTAGSAFLAEHIPETDAALVARLRRAGSVFVGKTNLDELALGVTSVSPVGGATLNPWDGQSTAGGSSGGSGAAVAAGMCVAATASDTGGSIRNPSAWNGVTGLKPTYGAVSAQGMIPLSWSLDTAGFLAHTTAECAELFAASADHLFGAPAAVQSQFVERASRPAERLRIGVAGNMVELADKAVAEPFRDAVDRIADGMGDVIEVALPRVDDSLLAAMIIILAEGAAMYERGLRSNGNAFGQPVRALLDTGRLIRATEYLHAQRIREEIRSEVGRLFEEVDVLLMPSMGLEPHLDALETYVMEHSDLPVVADGKFRCIWNLTGYPVLSIPCGFTAAERPIAMSVVGRPYSEEQLLRAGAAFEEVLAIPRERLVPTWVAATWRAEAIVDTGGN